MEFSSLKDLRLKGFAKFLHKCFIFVTYPFRHPMKFIIATLVIVIFLILWPLLKGVDFTDIPDWYTQKFESITNTSQKLTVTFKETPVFKVKQRPEKFAKKIELKHASITQKLPKEKTPEPQVQEINEPKKYATWHIQIEEQKKNKSEQEKQEENVSSSSSPKIEIKKQEQESETKISFKKIDGLPLIYLNTPEFVSGAAMVYGPNELFISDTYLYLYGIYTDPLKYDSKRAGNYLRELISGEKIECYIVAKTLDNIATAICLKGDQNINKSLVDAGFADDVAL